MVLIISERDDITTIEVINWLRYFNKKWVTVFPEDLIDLNFKEQEIYLIKNNSERISVEKVDSVWYRRGYFNFIRKPRVNNSELDGVLWEEFQKLKEYFFYKLGQKRTINSIINTDLNKLIVSEMAMSVNIKTPENFLFNNNSDLLNFFERNKKQFFITKVINGSCSYNINDFELYNFTCEINVNDIITNPAFFYSLIQQKIEKKIEIRSFFLKERYYSMAIFSQSSKKASIDYRDVEDINSLRYVPFIIPKKVESKLKKLMKILNLDCGSIDLIVTNKNEYCFLEVNPIGQLSMVSYPCNYYLEKKIAEYL